MSGKKDKLRSSDKQLQQALLKLGELRPNAVRKDYEGEFHNHATRLVSYDLACTPHEKRNQFKMSNQYYAGVQQSAIENAEMIELAEAKEINWTAVDRSVVGLKKQVSLVLGKEANSEELKPFVSATLDSYENWLIYSQMYSDSAFNAWTPMISLIKRGMLFLVTAEDAMLQHYLKKQYTNHKDKYPQNIGLVVKSRRSRTSGFLVDDRYEIQMLVYEFLREQAPSHESAKSLRKIREFLLGKKFKMTEDTIQIKITTPLKKTGFIGSSTEGFFYIASIEDLRHSYCFHKTKSSSILRIMNVYRRRSDQFGGVDLDELCDDHV